MRNPIMIQLRQAVREVIAETFASTGYAKPRDVARQVCASFPEAIESVGSRLAEDALTEIARGLLKKATQNPQAATQLQLHWLDAPLTANLPVAISIPAGTGGLDDEDSVIYKPLSRATVSDLDAHLALLVSQIVADTRRHRALKELRDIAIALGATADSLVLVATAPANEAEAA